MDEKIVAQDGKDRFLVQVDDEEYRVLDLENRRYWPPRGLEDIVGVESWGPPVDDRPLDELLEHVEEPEAEEA